MSSIGQRIGERFYQQMSNESGSINTQIDVCAKYELRQALLGRWLDRELERIEAVERMARLDVERRGWAANVVSGILLPPRGTDNNEKINRFPALISWLIISPFATCTVGPDEKARKVFQFEDEWDEPIQPRFRSLEVPPG